MDGGREEMLVQEVDLGQEKEEGMVEWRKERTEQDKKLSREEGL